MEYADAWGDLANEVLALEQAVPAHVDHHVPSSDRWPWLPVERSGVLARHAYCSDCGLVRTVGAERARDLGGLVNVVARLARALAEGGHKVTQAQRRLILQRLRRDGADDAFGLTRASQTRLLTQTVAGTLGLAPTVVDTYLRSC